jgi:truncated hemoglobin YjbI
MGQRQPFSGTERSDWLSVLVATYDSVERQSGEPCDAADREALLSRLHRPAIHAGGVRRETPALSCQN